MKHIACIILLLSCAVQGALSQTDIFIRGSGKLYPIAIPRLCVESGGGAGADQDIANAMMRDLDLSGYFEVLQPNAFIEAPGKCSGRDGFAYSDWSVIGAEGLVKGVIQQRGDTITIQLYLHDVSRQQVVLGKEYEAHVSQGRDLAHRFANEVLRYFTGEYGPFGSKIAFSSKLGRFKELFVMDMDGSSLRQLTDERGLALSPAWNRTGDRLVFTGYRNRFPDLFVIDVSRRRIEQITQGPQLEVGAVFTPDGEYFLTAQSRGKDSDIVVLNRTGQLVRQLTRGVGTIDVSPSWSPDFQQIVFVSNRGGGPQVYVMNADGSNARRVSFVTSNYCTDPEWSPKGDRLAFVCRAEGGFNIFTSRPDGSDALQLTSLGNNESPSWSPDGRYLAFSTDARRRGATAIAIMRKDGSAVKFLTDSRLGDTGPSWGPLPR